MFHVMTEQIPWRKGKCWNKNIIIKYFFQFQIIVETNILIAYFLFPQFLLLDHL